MSPNNALRASAGDGGTKPNTSVLTRATIEDRGIGTADDVEHDIALFLAECAPSVRSELRAFFTLLTFFTTLPGPSWADHHPGFLMRGMAYVPVVAAFIGAYVAIFLDAALALGLPATAAAALSNAASLWLTGCFHEDGLADTADSFGGGWTRSQIKRIMADSRLGTYGCAVLALYLLAKVALVAALGASTWLPLACTGGGPALLCAHVLARCSAVLLIRGYPYIADDGPKTNFYNWMSHANALVSRARVAVVLTLASVTACALYGPATAALLMGVVFAVTFGAGRYGSAVLGGVMGDFLGATICVTEIALLAIIEAGPTLHAFIHRVAAVIAGDAPNWGPALIAMVTGSAEARAMLRLLLLMAAVCAWSSVVGTVKRWPKAEGESSGCSVPAAGTAADASDDAGSVDEAEETEEDSPFSAGSFSSRHAAAMAAITALAKPVGSLGTLEEWCARLCALQRRRAPTVTAATLVFAADHGVARPTTHGGEACSAYPTAVTTAVSRLIADGRAGVSTIAASVGVECVRIYDVGLADGMGERSPGVRRALHRLPGGTQNFTNAPAMLEEELDSLMAAGAAAVDELPDGVTAVALGEIGIGNTTAASALYAALALQDGDADTEHVAALCGRGTGLDDAGVARKVDIVVRALHKHASVVREGRTGRQARRILAALGGAEIAAMAGAALRAHELGLAVVVDGFIATSAALSAAAIDPLVTQSFFFATLSAERGHRVAVDRIIELARAAGLPEPAPPALAMNLCLGEGSAATLSIPLLRASARLLCDMATLAEALG